MTDLPIVGGGNIPGGGVNLITDSWQFDSAFWGGATANATLTAAQPDPVGGSKATDFANIGAASAWHQEITTQFSPNSIGFAGVSDIVVSMYIKAGVGGDVPHGKIRLYNLTIGTAAGGMCEEQYKFASGVASHLSSAGQGANGGVVDVGGGWYRPWIHIDLAANKLLGTPWADSDLYAARIMPWDGDNTVGRSLVVFGYQIEPGTAPGPYKEKP